MSQTTAPLRNMVPGRLGLAAEPFNPSTIETKVQPAGKSYFGRMLVDDFAGGEERVKHPTATGQKPLGVVMSSHSMVQNEDGDDPNYAAKDAVKIMNKGRIWVAIEEDIAVGDDVFFRHTAGTGTKLGAFRNDADTASADQLTNGRWVKGGTAAEGIALLELDVLA